MNDSAGTPANNSPSNLERRSTPRYSFMANAEIVEPASDTHISGRITDIGRNGCYVSVLNPLPKGTIIQLRISRDTGAFMTSGQIMYAQDGMGMGVGFVEVPGDQQKVLDSWLAELSSSPPRPEIPGFAAEVVQGLAMSAPSPNVAPKQAAPSSPPYVAQERAARPSSLHVAEQTPPRKSGSWIGVTLGSILILGALFVWWRHASSSPTIVSSPDAAATAPAPETTASTPRPAENLPVGPGEIATTGELSKAWSSKRFLFRSPVTAEMVPAMVVHLPSGVYWGFFLREPASTCEMELVTDLQKLQTYYAFHADHPMLGDPCNRSVFDLTRYGPGTNGLVRGEVEQGTSARPPIAIEIQTRGNQVLAVRAE